MEIATLRRDDASAHSSEQFCGSTIALMRLLAGDQCPRMLRLSSWRCMLLLGPGCCECLVTDCRCCAVLCSCQWGYGGADCSVLKLPACRQSDEPWAPVHTGWMPKACECYRQAAAHIEVCGHGHVK